MNIKKITSFNGKDVASAPDKLTGTAQENKAVFDRAVKDVVASAYNELVDELNSDSLQRDTQFNSINTALGEKADKTQLDGKLDKTGGTVTGHLTVNNGISATGVSYIDDVTADSLGAPKIWLGENGADSEESCAISRDGQGNIKVTGKGFDSSSEEVFSYSPEIIGIGEPTQGNSAANKAYVDGKTAGIRTYYGTCSNSGSALTATTLSDFKLEAGAIVTVKFTYGSSPVNSTDATLNVNGSGAKRIMLRDTKGVRPGMWAPGAVVSFVYDGTNYVMENGSLATTYNYGITTLSNATDSTYEYCAATPAAVNAVRTQLQNSKADKTYVDTELAKKLDKTGGTVSGELSIENIPDEPMATRINATNIMFDCDSLRTGMKADLYGEKIVFYNIGDEPEPDWNNPPPAIVTNIAAPTNDTDAANKKYVDDAVANVSGGSGSGGVSKTYVDTELAKKLNETGGTMTGDLIVGGDSEPFSTIIKPDWGVVFDYDAATSGIRAGDGYIELYSQGYDPDWTEAPTSVRLTNLAAPTQPADAANKKYVDEKQKYVKLFDSVTQENQSSVKFSVINPKTNEVYRDYRVVIDVANCSADYKLRMRFFAGTESNPMANRIFTQTSQSITANHCYRGVYSIEIVDDMAFVNGSGLPYANGTTPELSTMRSTYGNMGAGINYEQFTTMYIEQFYTNSYVFPAGTRIRVYGK